MTTKLKPTDRQQAMHETHGTWRAEHDAWRDDARVWAAQYHRTLADLARVEALIRDHGAALQEHEASLLTHDRAIGVHERGLAELHAKGLGDQYDPATPEHATWIERHHQEREEHQRMKASHHAVVALVRKLLATALESTKDSCCG